MKGWIASRTDVSSIMGKTNLGCVLRGDLCQAICSASEASHLNAVDSEQSTH